MLAAGDKFERYKIEVLLGQGGMGQVYRAYDSRLRRRVALKVLRADKGAAHDTGHDVQLPADRLLREARAAAALSHPNVVAIFDVGEWGDVPYIVMELVEGRSLGHYVGDRAITTTKKIVWLLEVARALAAAHERGLVHRDVKPENILVCDDGGVKVLDFGIAKPISLGIGDDGVAVDSPISVRETGGRIIGTPRFMSPEQVRGDPVDARTDQFSWALVAYELLAGVHAWSTVADGAQTLTQAICFLYPKALREIAPECPVGIEGVIWRALAKEPERRYDSMAEIVLALEREVRRSEPPSGALSGAVTGASSPQAARGAFAEAETADARTARAFAGAGVAATQPMTAPAMAYAPPPPLQAPAAFRTPASAPTSRVLRQPSGCVPYGLLVVGIVVAVPGLVTLAFGGLMFVPPIREEDLAVAWTSAAIGLAIVLPAFAMILAAILLLARTKRFARIAAILSVAPAAPAALVARELAITEARARSLLAAGVARRYWR